MNVEQAYLIKCERLPLLTDKKPSSALINYTKAAAFYHECAAKQKALADAVELHNNSASN